MRYKFLMRKEGEIKMKNELIITMIIACALYLQFWTDVLEKGL